MRKLGLRMESSPPSAEEWGHKTLQILIPSLYVQRLFLDYYVLNIKLFIMFQILIFYHWKSKLLATVFASSPFLSLPFLFPPFSFPSPFSLSLPFRSVPFSSLPFPSLSIYCFPTHCLLLCVLFPQKWSLSSWRSGGGWGGGLIRS